MRSLQREHVERARARAHARSKRIQSARFGRLPAIERERSVERERVLLAASARPCSTVRELIGSAGRGNRTQIPR